MPVNRHVIEQALSVSQVAAGQASDNENEGGNSGKNGAAFHGGTAFLVPGAFSSEVDTGSR